jgi:hypothetical protein
VAAESAPLFFLDRRTLNPLQSNDNGTAVLEGTTVELMPGYTATHSASDTEYDWPWYGGLVGAYLRDHPGVPGSTSSSRKQR